MTKSNYKLTKEDFKQINRRSLFTFQLGWNYERMQGSGYLYTILPQLRKIYGDNTPELKEMIKTHTQFFNTIITGIDLAMEEKEGISLVTTMQSCLTVLTDAETLLEIFIVGALVVTMINVKFSWSPTIGDVTLNMQNYIDMILPKILPAGIAGGVYWLLGKKYNSYSSDFYRVNCV
ncbi:PTS system mannose/fructose/sorbose family transporter subunit IID [Enterococcus faecium]|nr:PTS system mannose/fructose/sorbose family transporter subunit IID [Enterococcus faecium]